MIQQETNSIYAIECSRLETTYFGKKPQKIGERTAFEFKGNNLVSFVTSELRKTQEQKFLYRGDSVIIE